jgi:preprotein translocase subunit SecA
MTLRTQALPRPGPRWGAHPQRPDGAPPRHAQGSPVPGWAAHLAPLLPPAWVVRTHAAWLDQVSQSALQWRQHPPRTPAWQQGLVQLRQQLHRQGLGAQALSQALGCLVVAIEQTQGIALSAPQLLAATFLLDNHLAELPTGEGKTLAMAVAAAVAGLAGVPTHVMTANSYLAQRDALALTELWRALDLNVTCLIDGQSPDERRQAHRGHIVYGTAKDFAFDHLRDQALTGAGPRSPSEHPLLPGLCLALLDEADSLLLDEANVPLVLSAPLEQSASALAQRRALWWQAWSLSGQMSMTAHAELNASSNMVTLTPEGRRCLEAMSADLGGLWARTRVREDLIQLALSARHGLIRDVHYLVRDGEVQLLDALTGRIAVGRVLSQGLHTLLEIKEGLKLKPPSQTVAQITFPRFLGRYWRLGGLSATLSDDRSELEALHGLKVVCLPTRLPSQRQTWPTVHCSSQAKRWQWVARRVQTLQAQGRPVLIGTDTVEASQALSAVLAAHGIGHVVLNAHHDAAEAAIVAQAGQAGAVTVATRMAGRGTDIQLNEHALAAGGLHVIHCQRNESPRMDRQLLGRCARQGQPGSTEAVICERNSSEQSSSPIVKLLTYRRTDTRTSPRWLALWHLALQRLSQRWQAQRLSSIRRRLLEQDCQWDTQRHNARPSR